MNPRRTHPAFTLIELMLVLAVIGTVLAMAAPSLRGWSRGRTLDGVAAGFLATTRLARAQAVAECRVYRIELTANGYRLALQEGEQFVQTGTSLGRAFLLPDDWQIRLWVPAGGGGQTIRFYPNGRCDLARVVFVADNGRSTEVRCDTPAEGFRVAAGSEALP